MTPLPEIRITAPQWLTGLLDWDAVYRAGEDRMRVAIRVARENVLRDGGPFGAAVFESGSGRLVSAGTNLVLPLHNSMLHAEVVALMLAEARLKSRTLGGGNPHELVTSCEPCAMCLGAVHWSGIAALTCGATREDAEKIGFAEGPVFEDSWRYLTTRGLVVRRGVCREEAAEVLTLYADRNGVIY